MDASREPENDPISNGDADDGGQNASGTIPRVVWIFLAVLALLSIRYGGVLAFGQEFCAREHVLFLKPMCDFVRSEVHDGRLSLWCPYLFLGIPVLADLLPSVFYPLATPLLVPRYDTGCAIYLIINQFISF